MMRFIGLVAFLWWHPIVGYSQIDNNNVVQGEAGHLNSNGEKELLVGANVYWAGTNLGVVTDLEGQFQIERSDISNKLVCSYVGFMNDTIEVADQSFMRFELTEAMLDEVEVVHRNKSTEISLIDPLKVERISEKELLKAACCNLSESFETNPSVDVSFTDAVTGVRQIQMLGLASPYTVIERENMPDVRGMAAIYGTTFTPGTWVEGMQLVKGTGSVAIGYEAVAGQINVELRKPMTADRLYVNLYANEEQRLEGNVNFAQKVDDRWYTGLLLHGSNHVKRHDRNQDGFLDMPIGGQFVGLNRWHYIGQNGVRFQAGVKATIMDKTGGERDYGVENPNSSRQLWGMDLNINRYEGWMKVGKVFEDVPWRSLGFQMSFTAHDQDSKYGLLDYQANQTSWFGKFLYNSIIGNTHHKFLTGLSFKHEVYDEILSDIGYGRTEIVPGAFFEYSYNPGDKLVMIAGIRADVHNLIGAFLTPRLHMRYAVSENAALRISAGKGLRSANIFAENHGIFATSREIKVMADPDEENAYGLKPDVAWNFGVNFAQKFSVGQKAGSISFDYYRTDFQDQVILDLDYSAREALFYNLEGKSYSNSFQAQLDYELAYRLDLRLAYRWYDVVSKYRTGILQKPLVAAHRAFINLGYETGNKWKFDVTVNWQGAKRIPSTAINPEPYRMPETSPDFLLTNFQITKGLQHKWEFYLGVENLFNFQQKNAIIASDQPYSPYFDSSLIWGPIFGRNIYAGMRFRLK